MGQQNALTLAHSVPMVEDVGSPILGLARRYTQGRIARREVLPSTAHRQLIVLRSFADSFGNRDVKKLARADIERWIATRAHLAAGTRYYERKTMRQFVLWLQRNRHIRSNPMADIKNPTLPRRVPRALTKAEDDALEAVLPDSRARAIYALMRFEGLRKCEVRSAQVGDWDRATNILRVIGKGRHEREVPVTQRAATCLNAYLAEHPAHAGPLIRRHDGTGPLSNSWLGKMMQDWMELAHVKTAAYDGKACHSLRHTIASEVADAEPDLRVVQQLLGHVHLSSTEIYLRRARMSKVRAAMERAAS